MLPRKPGQDKNTEGSTTFLQMAGVAVFCLLPVLLLAAGPQWWTDRGVLVNGKAANDYGAVNQGQLKNIAVAAVAEMNAGLPGGAGDTLNAFSLQLSATTAQTNDYGAVNLGQLKTVAQPFYDRLIEVGYTYQYPWLSSTNTNDYAMANIGQVKNLFSFDLSGYAIPPVAQDLNFTVANDTATSLPVTLQASGSMGQSLTYTLLSSPAHGTLTGEAPYLSYAPSLNAAGTETFTYKANDGLHDSNTATVTIAVKAPPRVFAGANQSIALSGSASLAGTVVDLDTPSASLAYTWQKNSGPGAVTFANQSALQTTATFSAAGAYQLQLVVSDGEYSRAGIVTVYVNADSATPPTVNLTSPADGTVITKPAVVSLAATAASSSSTIAKVEFYQGSQKVGESTAAPYAYDWQGAYAGVYSLSAKAIDAQGAATFSSAVVIKVINAGDSTTPPGSGDTPTGAAPDPNNPDQDTDGDGAPDSQDDYPDDPNRTKDVPVMQLAAIDISGDSTEGKDVTMMALDDDNKAAFAYKSDDDHLKVWTWDNGTATLNQTVPLASTESTVNIDNVGYVEQGMSWKPGGLLASGKVYGLFTGGGNVFGPDGYQIGDGVAYLGFTCEGGERSITGNIYLTHSLVSGSADEVMSDLWNAGTHGDWNWGEMAAYFIQGASPGGYFFGDDNGSGFVFPSGGMTIFVDSTDYIPEDPDAKPFPGYPDTPIAMNDNGWAIFGNNWAPLWEEDPMRWGNYFLTEPYAVWNGTDVISLPDNPAAINASGWVVGGGFNMGTWDGDIQVSGTSEGYLWKDGQITLVKDLLPKEFENQIKNVTPGLISNPDSDNNDAYNIVFNADSLEGSGTGTWVNYNFLLNISGTNVTVSKLYMPTGIYGFQSINKLGVFSAITPTIVADDGSTTKPKALLLVQEEFITRDSESGRIMPLDVTSTQSNPIPDVTMKLTESRINAAGQLELKVSGTLRDFLSDLADNTADRVQTLQFKVNGELIDTIDNLPTQSTGSGVMPWQPYKLQVPFQKTITVDQPEGQTIIVRAESSPNAAGNKGWSSIAVAVAWEPITYTDPSNMDDMYNGIHIAFSAWPTDAVIDSARVYTGNRGPTTSDDQIMETSGTSLSFTGSGKTLQIDWLGNPNAGERKAFQGTLTSGTSPLAGVWYETSAGSNIFFLDPATYVPAKPEAQIVVQDSVSDRSPHGWLSPIIWRTSLSHTYIDQNNIKLSINDAEQKLKPFIYSPEKEYVVSSVNENRPQIFVITAEPGQLPSSLRISPPNFTIIQDGVDLEYKLKFGDTVVPAATVRLYDGDFGTVNPEPNPQKALLNRGMLLKFFALLFKNIPNQTNPPQPEDLNYGLLLLNWYEEAGNQVVIEKDVKTFWHSTPFDVSRPKELNGNIKIRLDSNLNPVDGAMALWKALAEAMPMAPFKEKIFAEALQPTNFWMLSMGWEATQATVNSAVQQAVQYTQQATDIYIACMEVLTPGGQFVLVVKDGSDGHCAMAMLGAVPFVHGGAALIKNAAGEVLARLSRTEVIILKDIVSLSRVVTPFSKLKKRVEIMKVIGAAYKERAFSATALKALVKTGFIPKCSKDIERRHARDILASVEAIPKNLRDPECQHDLPLELIDFFLTHGFDPNDPEFTRWAEAIEHAKWHAGIPAKGLGRFNDVWRDWIRQHPEATYDEIYSQFQKMRADYQ